MFDGFINPGLAIGASLAAVPLIIHLLNRRRHKPLEWAAMRFVLAAYKRTRRRARLENLLLLLLRMAAVALLAFAVSRPFTGAQSPLAGLTQSRRDVVLVLDGSASTGYREEVGTVFGRIVDRARELVLELDSGRGDRVRLVLAASYPRLLSWRSPEEAFSLLGTLSEPTDEPLDLAAALGEVAGYAEEEAGEGGRTGLEIRLLTDLQRRNLELDASAASDPSAQPPEGSAGDAARRPLLAEELDRLQALGARVLVEDLGPREAVPANLSVVSIDALGTLLGPGAPVDYSVRVRNWGPNVRAGVRVVLEVDGQRRPAKLLSIPARGESQAVFNLVFRTPGPHVLAAQVEADRLVVDDQRVQVVSVPPPVRVLLVNGDPRPEIDEDEVGFLSAVLEPPRGDDMFALGVAPFEARVVEPFDLRDETVDFAEYDVIVLANVKSLADRTVERLEQRVAAGAALLVCVGDGVAQEGVVNYNRRLFRADGSGLLPAELGQKIAIANRRQNYYRIGEFQAEHPVLSFFADETWRPLLTEVPIYEFLSARPLELENETVRVLARLDDDAKSPLFIERDYDRGKVFLWLTTIDHAWTRLPDSPKTLVPLVHELMRYASSASSTPRNLGVGGQLAAQVESFPRSIAVVRPDGSRRPLEGEPLPLGPGTWGLPPFADTERTGLYRFEMEGLEALPFAVQMDASEGDLERSGPLELAGLHSSLVLVGAESSDGSSGDPELPREGELWRVLALACFLALVLETLWSAFLGRKRRIGS